VISTADAIASGIRRQRYDSFNRSGGNFRRTALSYHPGDAADAETLGTLNLARALRDTLKRQGVCVFFDEHEIGDFESITAAPEGRRRPFAFAARPLPADVPDATRLPVPS
jgi:hypothetical protein